MTREEAIKYGIEWLKDECLDAKDRAFIKIALDALEQEPCDVSDTNVGKTDISRQAAIEKIHWLGIDNDTAIMCDLAIRALPSVTPKQRTGRWERHYIRPNVYADLFWHCSACGDKCGYNNANLFEYCPHCGAKMEEQA